ncbi:MAG: CopG family transcriptional regulator [Anaerolineae bacterium]|nr:CopG family transcriptional regulator [Anaerolineae bacterium]
MSHRATITLDPEAYSFLISTAKGNRSAYINALLKKEKRHVLEQDILRANQEEAGDPEYLEELAAWEETLVDGI